MIHMPKLLLNANLSPQTAKFLREMFGFDVRCLLEEGRSDFSDPEVVEMAKQENRIIITYDLDFANLYYFDKQREVGMIVLRLRDQTIESVNKRLETFFKEINKESAEINNAMIVVDETRYRISLVKDN